MLWRTTFTENQIRKCSFNRGLHKISRDRIDKFPSRDKMNDIFAIVTGVLTLGNVDFKQSDEGVKANEVCLEVAECLGLNAEALEEVICFKKLEVNNNTIKTPRTEDPTWWRSISVQPLSMYRPSRVIWFARKRE